MFIHIRCKVILSFKKSKATDLSSLNSLEKRAAQAKLEPVTHRLLGRCSTTELPRQLNGWARSRQYMDLHKSKQGNTTNLNISYSISMENEKRAAQVGFKPTNTAYEADALPTELPRHLSWLDRIKAIQGKGNQSNLT